MQHFSGCLGLLLLGAHWGHCQTPPLEADGFCPFPRWIRCCGRGCTARVCQPCQPSSSTTTPCSGQATWARRTALTPPRGCPMSTPSTGETPGQLREPGKGTHSYGELLLPTEMPSQTAGNSAGLCLYFVRQSKFPDCYLLVAY